MLKRTAFVLALLLLLAWARRVAQDGPAARLTHFTRRARAGPPGSYAIGVRIGTGQPGQLDIANAPGGADIPTYDAPSRLRCGIQRWSLKPSPRSAR